MSGQLAPARYDYFAALVRQGRRPVEFVHWAEHLTPGEFDAVLDRAWEEGVAGRSLQRLGEVQRLKEHARRALHTGRLDPAVALDALLTLAEPLDGPLTPV